MAWMARASHPWPNWCPSRRADRGRLLVLRSCSQLDALSRGRVCLPPATPASGSCSPQSPSDAACHSGDCDPSLGGSVCILELKQPLPPQGPQVPKIFRDDRIRVLSVFKIRSLIPLAKLLPASAGELLGVLTASACEGWGGLKQVGGAARRFRT